MFVRDCYTCKYYTGDTFLPCAVDPSTATNSPQEGCRDWELNDYHQPVALKVERPRATGWFWFGPCMGVVYLYLAIAAWYAVAAADRNYDPYELSPPGSVQHYRED